MAEIPQMHRGVVVAVRQGIPYEPAPLAKDLRPVRAGLEGGNFNRCMQKR